MNFIEPIMQMGDKTEDNEKLGKHLLCGDFIT
jgi:hypothetical protein